MAVLAQIDPAKGADTVALGSLVTVATGTFYFAVGAGALKHNGTTVMAISPGSPIGQAMLGKRAGETYSFRGQEMQVIAVV